MTTEKDFLLDSYNFNLPDSSIAQYPCKEPGSSRLLVMSRKADPCEKNGSPGLVNASFARLADFLPENALVVANNSRVLPARLTGQRAGGGKAEFLLLTPLPLIINAQMADGDSGKFLANAECLLRPSAKIHIGDTLTFGSRIQARILKKGEYGKHEAELSWHGNLEQIFEEQGKMPLPPYIRRRAGLEDTRRYQTIYAKKAGSVAAPTAGLHFTPEIRRSLLDKGCQWQEVTLFVGYGTFSPVRCHDIRQHTMHSEYVEISRDTAAAINAAKADGRPVVAIGTTALRAMEGVRAKLGHMDAYQGWTDIFIYPGKKFRVADCLVTNFHLPQSSLLMLVSAFAGRERILAAYRHAVLSGYRFFSYGDAMLIR